MNHQQNYPRNVYLIFLLSSLIGIFGGLSYATEELILALGSSQVGLTITGNTGGAYSLASLSNHDLNGTPCLGYGDPQPDRILQLKSDFENLTFEVNSNGQDTTLVIKSLETGVVRCGFGKNNSRDALIFDRNWSAGTYHIWVGSMAPNRRSSYRLSVRP